MVVNASLAPAVINPVGPPVRSPFARFNPPDCIRSDHDGSGWLPGAWLVAAVAAGAAGAPMPPAPPIPPIPPALASSSAMRRSAVSSSLSPKALPQCVKFLLLLRRQCTATARRVIGRARLRRALRKVVAESLSEPLFRLVRVLDDLIQACFHLLGVLRRRKRSKVVLQQHVFNVRHLPERAASFRCVPHGLQDAE